MCVLFVTTRHAGVKVKLWWVEARERETSVFLIPLFSPKEVFGAFVFYLDAQYIE